MLPLAALRTQAAARTHLQVRSAANADLGFANQETSACVSLVVIGSETLKPQGHGL